MAIADSLGFDRAVSGAIHGLINIGYGLEFGLTALVAEGTDRCPNVLCVLSDPEPRSQVLPKVPLRHLKWRHCSLRPGPQLLCLQLALLQRYLQSSGLAVHLLLRSRQLSIRFRSSGPSPLPNRQTILPIWQPN